jgi:sugar O-acyltransferase (sialic acid O-acetyltransferase NeuD family)
VTAETISERYVLWGSKGHALVLNAAIRLRGGSVVALFDNDHEAKPVLPGVPLHVGRAGLSVFLASHQASDYAALVAVGGGQGSARRQLLTMLAETGFRAPPLIHPRAHVCDTAKIGAGVQVLAHATVAAAARIEDACIVNHGAIIDHECSLGAGTHVAPGAILCGCIDVGQDVFVGAGATILPRIRIGAGATIGAGAVVTRDVLAGQVVVGNPARAHSLAEGQGL